MRVWDYVHKRYDELGRETWEIEWITVRPEVLATKDFENGFIDPDSDTITNVEFHETEEQALKRAQEIYDTVNGPNGEGLCWGVVMVQKQVLEMYVEENRVATWENVGESIEISDFSSTAGPPTQVSISPPIQ